MVAPVPKTPNVSGVLSGRVLNINVTMTGWDQLVNATQTVQTQFVTQSLDPGINNLNNFCWNKMKEKVHVWMGKRKRGTPHMRDVIRELKRGVAQYTVNVPTRYAQKENIRPGGKYGTPHRFVEPAIQMTILHVPVIAAELQRWIDAKFNAVKG